MKDLPESKETQLLPMLYERIERAWNEWRDHSLVDALAEEHPELAASLYEFFGLVIGAEYEVDERRPEFGLLDAKSRAWLRQEGYEMIRSSVPNQSTTGATGPATPSADGAMVSDRASTDAPQVLDTHGAVAGSVGDTLARASPGTIRQANHDYGDREQAGELSTDSERPPVSGIAGAGVSAFVGTVSEAGARATQLLSFVGYLKQKSRQRTPQIAEQLELTADVLQAADRIGMRLPIRVQDELVMLAARKFASLGVSADDARAHLSVIDTPLAASRSGPYTDARTSFEDAVRRSSMSPSQQARWLMLAAELAAEDR